MRLSSWSLLLWMLALAHAALATGSDAPANPAIDMDGFLRVANETAAHRASHRLSEDEFIRMSRMPGTVILDARSVAMYEFLHVRGAINLSFPDIAIGSLAQTIPDKDTRILIYCNNNFLQEPEAFRTKNLRASLNIYTFNVLYSYGYTNVYELGPLLDINQTKLKFEGTRTPG
jgi:rhodanese-like protein